MAAERVDGKSSERWGKRALVAAVSSALALGAAWLVLGQQRAAEPLEFHEAELGRVAALVERDRGEGPERWRLSHEAVDALFSLRPRLRRYDPFCYFTYKPNLVLPMTWEERPEGSYEKRTNSLGIVREGELAAEKPDLRVLVAGDSHVDGVVNDDETFPARLEATLAAEDPARSVEVINAAHGAYSFFHYHGVLERFLDLDLAPDVFVVVVYGGNDFGALPQLWHLFQGDERPVPDPERQRRKRELLERYRPEFGQCLNAVELFRSEPEEVEVALRAAAEVTDAIRARCDAHGIRLLFVYLPCPTEVPGRAVLERMDAAVTAFGLEPEDLARIGAMADRWLARLADEGIETLDLRPDFAAAAGRLYWETDLHLDVAGHRRVAAAVRERLRAFGL